MYQSYIQINKQNSIFFFFIFFCLSRLYHRAYQTIRCPNTYILYLWLPTRYCKWTIKDGDAMNSRKSYIVRFSMYTLLSRHTFSFSSMKKSIFIIMGARLQGIMQLVWKLSDKVCRRLLRYEWIRFKVDSYIKYL